jgi:sugar lactone lactonase YvrE
MHRRRFSTIRLASILSLPIALHFFSGPALTTTMAAPSLSTPTTTLLTSGLAGGSGSTIGPGGALFVTEGAAGRILRVDLQTGEVTTFASGLPPTIPAIGIGGAIDVAFIGSTAYTLVTLVGADVGGQDVVGIYRIDGPNSVTPIADIGEFALNNPPVTAFDVPTGVQYALEPFRGGFLVSDGHHNRVLHVELERRGGTEHGRVTEFRAFDNIVPTGLAVHGQTIYMAEAGPVPHLPEDGKIVTFTPESPVVQEVASGAQLLVDVEFGRGRTLFGLSQGDFPDGAPAGSPALPNTGALVRVNAAGSFTTVVDGLNQPTSLEITGTTAYVVTLAGDIWRIDGITGPPYGKLR